MARFLMETNGRYVPYQGMCKLENRACEVLTFKTKGLLKAYISRICSSEAKALWALSKVVFIFRDVCCPAVKCLHHMLVDEPYR
jgi:hypothetical protein